MAKEFRFFMTTADELIPFWEKCIVLAKAVGRELTRAEKEYVFHMMKIGKEVKLEDVAPGKKILIVSPEFKEREDGR